MTMLNIINSFAIGVCLIFSTPTPQKEERIQSSIECVTIEDNNCISERVYQYKKENEELLAKAKTIYMQKQEQKKKEEAKEKEKYLCDFLYKSYEFKKLGIVKYNGYKWTWYSQRVLPGGGLQIPGRHVDSSGYICDKDNYICLASSELPQGTIVNSPFGKKGKVYDSGCAAGTLDVYVDF